MRALGGSANSRRFWRQVMGGIASEDCSIVWQKIGFREWLAEDATCSFKQGTADFVGILQKLESSQSESAACSVLVGMSSGPEGLTSWVSQYRAGGRFQLMINQCRFARKFSFKNTRCDPPAERVEDAVTYRTWW